MLRGCSDNARFLHRDVTRTTERRVRVNTVVALPSKVAVITLHHTVFRSPVTAQWR